MGLGYCRFGCGEATSIDYMVRLDRVSVPLQVCGMWRHYMEKHNVKPPSRIRSLVLGTTTDIKGLPTSKFGFVMVLYVEKKGVGRYDHRVGRKPDREFIDRLERLIKEWGTAVHTMGIGTYRKMRGSAT